MKQNFLKKAILAGLLAFSTSCIALDSCMSGNWYDPTTPNSTGLTLEILNDGTIGAGHYYDWDNMERVTFLFLGANDIEDALVFKTYQTFHSDYSEDTFSYLNGTGSLTYIDNNTMRFEYLMTTDHTNAGSTIRWCYKEWCTEDVTYKRLTQPIECK